MKVIPLIFAVLFQSLFLVGICCGGKVGGLTAAYGTRYLQEASEDGCGECLLPTTEGDDAAAFLTVRLWKTPMSPDDYFDVSYENARPILTTSKGFISYVGLVSVDDPNYFLFYDIYDTKENADAAHEKLYFYSQNGTVQSDQDNVEEEKLFAYEGNITLTLSAAEGGGADGQRCIDSSLNHSGDYLAMRLYEGVDPNTPDVVSSLYEKWSSMNGFRFYISSDGGTGSSTVTANNNAELYMDVFDNVDTVIDSNQMALKHSYLVPTYKIVSSFVGEIAFDYTCGNNGNNNGHDHGSHDLDNDKEDDEDEDEEEGSRDTDIFGLVCNCSDLTVLCSLVNECYFAFKDAVSPFTLFAPTDASFAELDAAVGGLDTVDTDTLCDILGFHGVSGNALKSNDFNCQSGDSSLIEMVNGKNARIKCRSDNNGGMPLPYGIKGGGNIEPAIFIEADINATNGIIHIIDGVLLYPGETD